MKKVSMVNIIEGILVVAIISFIGFVWSKYNKFNEIQDSYLQQIKQSKNLESGLLKIQAQVDSQYKLFEDINNQLEKIKEYIGMENPDSIDYIYFDPFDRIGSYWLNDDDRYISKGSYIWNIKDGDHYIRYTNNNIPDLLSDSDIELEVEWLEGMVNKSFGLVVGNLQKRYYFETTAEGCGKVSFVIKNEFEDKAPIPLNINLPKMKDKKYILKISRRNKEISYYINNHLVGQCQNKITAWNEIGLFVQGTQKVEFRELRIRKL